MVADGYGQHPDHETSAQTVDDDDTTAVTAIGELVADHVVPLDDVDRRYREMWQDEDWFPAAGESIVAEDVPAYLNEFVVETYPGGRGPNQAVSAALSGANTSFYGMVGPGGDPLLDELAEHGVDVGDVAYDAAKEESTCYVMVEDDGENRIAFMRGTNSAPTRDYLDERVSSTSADYLLLHNGDPADTIKRVLDTVEEQEEGPSVIFDPAPVDGADQWLDYDCVDIVTPNEVEYAALDDVLGDYDGTVIQTSADGATVDTGHDRYHVSSPEVDVVDTTGAGDTLNGYLAGCLSQGATTEEAVTYAVYAASLSVTREGAQPSMPALEEVERFMDGG